MYRVIGQYFSCDEIHDLHSSLKEVSACYDELSKVYESTIPIHPVSQQYVMVIEKVDKNGNQLDFTQEDINEAETLNISEMSLAVKAPGVETFYRLATIYLEALNLCPLSTIGLKESTDSNRKTGHFWVTDAGIGQSLVYAQQAVFTLELSFKAYLEVLGKYAPRKRKDRSKWSRHEFVALYNKMSRREQEKLEDSWKHLEPELFRSKGTFKEVLVPYNKSYNKWRYLVDVTASHLNSIDLSVDVKVLLRASAFLLNASNKVYKEKMPVQTSVTVKVSAPTTSDESESELQIIDSSVEGLVRAVRIPEGFNPYGVVEVAIQPDNQLNEVVVQFNRRNVGDYFGLEGKRVWIRGYSTSGMPNVMRFHYFMSRPDLKNEYEIHVRTLEGTVFDLRLVNSIFGGTDKINLVLYDQTYFAQVECYFESTEEKQQLIDVGLGDKIHIAGEVVLRNGLPLVLVRPHDIVTL